MHAYQYRPTPHSCVDPGAAGGVRRRRGRRDESLSVWIAEQPDGWKGLIKTYQFEVSALHLPAGEDKTLTFEAVPEGRAKPGRYRFRIAAETDDAAVRLAENITVRVGHAGAAAGSSRGIAITASYPVLNGPVDSTFEYSLDVRNQLGQEAMFDLSAQAPEGWQVRFKPSYESKYISSLLIQAGQSRTVSVEVRPPPALRLLA